MLCSICNKDINTVSVHTITKTTTINALKLMNGILFFLKYCIAQCYLQDYSYFLNKHVHSVDKKLKFRSLQSRNSKLQIENVNQFRKMLFYKFGLLL